MVLRPLWHMDTNTDIILLKYVLTKAMQVHIGQKKEREKKKETLERQTVSQGYINPQNTI